MRHETVSFPSKATQMLSTIRPNSTFLTVRHYVNNFGELSDFSICFHVNYLNSVAKAKKLLEAYKPSWSDCSKRPFAIEHLHQAKNELIESFADTLAGDNPRATSAHAYREISNDFKETIPGIKLHLRQDIIHLWGFKLHKRVLMPGVYPADNRAAKTVAKDYLRDMSPLGRFTQYKLTTDRFHSVSVEGLTIREEDIIRESHSKLGMIGS